MASNSIKIPLTKAMTVVGDNVHTTGFWYNAGWSRQFGQQKQNKIYTREGSSLQSITTYEHALQDISQQWLLSS